MGIHSTLLHKNMKRNQEIEKKKPKSRESHRDVPGRKENKQRRPARLYRNKRKSSTIKLVIRSLMGRAHKYAP
jgi:hypothetical protein